MSAVLNSIEFFNDVIANVPLLLLSLSVYARDCESTMTPVSLYGNYFMKNLDRASNINPPKTMKPRIAVTAVSTLPCGNWLSKTDPTRMEKLLALLASHFS